MKMRDLEARTGVNRETIRVYFRKGLLPDPDRPKPNVAYYSEDHVKAIHAIRKLQQDTRLTLDEIKKLMDGEDAPRTMEISAFTQLEELVSARVGYHTKTVALADLQKHNPKARSDAEGLQEIGIVDIINGSEISVTDAGLIKAWSRMRAVGFSEETGYPPSVLFYYLKAAEYVAASEANIFFDQTEGRVTDETGAQMLEVALPAMLEFFGLIRLKAFLRNIGDMSKTGERVPIPPLDAKD